jgi:catechol 2,3-dioxygenase-like lactoylglutathione lyase family enzyme
MTAVLDHLAIGTPALTDGWDLFGGVLGGTWAYGGDSPGYWWGQLRFAAGPKIELLTPTGGSDAAFLKRFLAARGAGPHHFSFLVPDIEGALARIQASGIEPIGVNLANPDWREAFLHPRHAYGIVIQVAQQGGSPPRSSPPRALPEPGPPARLDLIEYHVGDLDGALRLFRDVLDGRLEAADAGTAELTWPGGERIRLVRQDGLPLGGGVHHMRFARAEGAFSAQDCQRAGLLAKRLGLTIELADWARTRPCLVKWERYQPGSARVRADEPGPPRSACLFLAAGRWLGGLPVLSRGAAGGGSSAGRCAGSGRRWCRSGGAALVLRTG